MKGSIEIFVMVLIVAVFSAITLVIWHERTECTKAGGVYVQTVGVPVCLHGVKKS